MLEYLLIIAVILGVIVISAKPFFKSLQQTFGDSFKSGIFGNDRADFYYFPLKRKQ